MAKGSMHQEPPMGEDWEEKLYQAGCAVIRQEAQERLKELDDWLHFYAPPDWEVVGFRERTIVCRFGEVRVQRRLYRDSEGRYHFALDEYLEWEPVP